MGWTKRQLIQQAFSGLALAGYSFDITPEEEQDSLCLLDTMMATWDAQGVQLGYALSADPDDSDVSADSGLPLYAVEAVYRALEIRIASGKGKQIPASTQIAASRAYAAMASKLVSDQTRPQQIASGTPLGAGLKTWRRSGSPFAATPNTAPVQVSPDGGIDFLGG